MVKNYLTAAIRFIHRNRTTSFISIVGLGVGIAACFWIIQYIRYEYSYDAHHQQTDRIYRLSTRLQTANSDEKIATTIIGTASLLNSATKEVKEIVRFNPVSATVQPNLSEAFQETRFYQADASAFDIFTYPLRYGKATEALTQPYSVVLTESTAIRYFGKDNLEAALGESLMINQEYYQITGILEDLPANSNLLFDGLLSWDLTTSREDVFFDMSAFTYVLLRKEASLASFKERLAEIDQYQFSPAIRRHWDTEETYASHLIIPLRQLHLERNLLGDTIGKGNAAYIIIFSIAGLFVLLMASINYINLFVGHSLKRNVEVGIRKVAGAIPEQLVLQYLSESLLITLLAGALAVLLIQTASTPQFAVLHMNVSIDLLLDAQAWMMLVALRLVVSILAVSYVAFFLASVKPTLSLKNIVMLPSGRLVRRSLQVAQFAIAIGMVICTLVVYQQMDYLRHKNLGFTQKSVLVVALPQDPKINKKLSKVTKAWKKHSEVKSVARGAKPGGAYMRGSVIQEVGGEQYDLPINALYVDEHYLDVLDINLVSGDTFQYCRSCRGDQYIVNEAFVEQMGWEDPVGQLIEYEGKGEIVGVVNDYHYQSLHNLIEPLILIYQPQQAQQLLVRVPPSAVADLASSWSATLPGLPFHHTFLNESIALQYQHEQKLLGVFSLFSLLTLCLAGMGLFGMTFLNIQHRTKEMGIRQVMGATQLGLMTYLSREIIMMALWAAVIALPLTYIFLQNWMQTFVYHTSISFLPFLGATGAMLLLTTATAWYHTQQITESNPVCSLRYE
ncbi:MAG: ABC transporter permease [Cyclobacteriaceae bacterium]